MAVLRRTALVAGLLILGNAAGWAAADTPANCSYPGFIGTWKFYEGSMGNTKTENCTMFDRASAMSTRMVTLNFPNIASDDNGMVGNWTLVYNEGFEVTFPDRVYMAFLDWKGEGKHVTSLCDQFKPGWAHTTTFDAAPTAWSCFKGIKEASESERQALRTTSIATEEDTTEEFESAKFGEVLDTRAFADKINNAGLSWTADSYDELFGSTSMANMRRRAGRRGALPPTAPVTQEHVESVAALPESWDWRTSAGPNRLPPIRNQGDCGSCYAFGSIEMVESRIRIMSEAKLSPTLSPQDVVSCSNYSHGCDGGFSYLVGGKYGHDYGFVEEKCAPYLGKNAPCTTNQACYRWRTGEHKYIGGFWGACNAQLMQIELVKKGPIAVAFNVTKEFFAYSGGVFQQNTTGITMGPTQPGNKFNPWLAQNHVVMVMGYGVENNLPYWTVQNSWGTKWGMSGFFKILRGVNELGIESSATTAYPILPAH